MNTSTLLQSGLEGSVHSEVQTGNHPAHHPPEAMEKRLIEWRKMWTCAEKVHWGDSNLHWQDISSSSLIHSQTLFMNQQYGSIQKKSQGSANEPKSTEATRSHWNIVRSPLVWFSLWSHHKWWSAKKARWTNATASSVKTSICEARQRPAKSGKAEPSSEVSRHKNQSTFPSQCELDSFLLFFTATIWDLSLLKCPHLLPPLPETHCS